MGYFRAAQNTFPEVQFIDEINEGITTIKLMEVKNGKLYGKISEKEGRIAYNSNNILTIQKDEEFEIPINQINLKNYYQAQNLPENTQFIASKQGKYYYSVLDKRALNIAEKNRIHFSSEMEAEEMGYLKK
ncbi:hypothetical protein KAR91_42350 [Candidatus Pacearchaeota archaeon]|nr:hypothetical protein [Candidatus Pacearchaeota archaeon]